MIENDTGLTITKIVEQSHVDSYEILKDFIRGELDSKINGLRNDLMCEIKDLKVSIAESQKDLLIKLFGIIA